MENVYARLKATTCRAQFLYIAVPLRMLGMKTLQYRARQVSSNLGTLGGHVLLPECFDANTSDGV